MGYNAYRYRRGTVWWLLAKQSGGYETGVLGKSRPVIVISSDESENSNSVTVVECTSADKKNKCSKINIPVRIDGKDSYVCCNQIVTVSKQKLSSYICTLTEEAMDAVDRGVLYANGFQKLLPVIDSVDEFKEAVLKICKSAYETQQPTHAEILSDFAAEINSALHRADDAIRLVDTAYAQAGRPSNSEETSIQNTTNNLSVAAIRRPHQRWTDDLACQFIEDYESRQYSVDEMMAMYSLTSAISVKSCYYHRLSQINSQ